MIYLPTMTHNLTILLCLLFYTNMFSYLYELLISVDLKTLSSQKNELQNEFLSPIFIRIYFRNAN